MTDDFMCKIWCLECMVWTSVCIWMPYVIELSICCMSFRQFDVVVYVVASSSWSESKPTWLWVRPNVLRNYWCKFQFSSNYGFYQLVKPAHGFYHFNILKLAALFVGTEDDLLSQRVKIDHIFSQGEKQGPQNRILWKAIFCQI